MNTVLLIAVGPKYVDILIEKYTLLHKESNIVVYTDNTAKVKKNTNITDIREYKLTPFRYFDKYTLTELITREIKAPVLYIDVGRLDVLKKFKYHYFNADKVNNVYTNSNWKGYETAESLKNYKGQYLEDNYWDDILEYMIKDGAILDQVIPLLERIFIFPYSPIINKVILELEKIRPVFERSSLSKINTYTGIGNGEGLALGYAFSKLKYKTSYLRDIPIELKEPYNII
jgi:hypothetical protein